MVSRKYARAVVEERDYAVAARVRDTDEAGETLPKSDRLMIAYEIQRGTARRGHLSLVVEDEGHYEVVAELGDASDADFEEAAGALLEASSW